MTENNQHFKFNIFCRDNNRGKKDVFSSDSTFDGKKQAVIESLNKIANKNLEKLTEDYTDLLVFPANFKIHKDEIGKSQILGINSDNKITTHNLMGFVGVDNVRLTIGSRFDKDEKNQFLLQYMLQKVFAINLVNLQTTVDNENIWDFLLFYIFPYYLNKALKQGVFKQYVRKQYNDSNVKGSVDVARHIRQNIPFMGNVAYNTREYSYDNTVTQLIRHTIEFIKATRFRNALSQSPQTVENVRLLQQLTPVYSLRDRQKVISQNLQLVSHPYFTEYEPLQKICLQILKYQGLALRKSSRRVYGVLFDGAWLWEEYLNVVLKENNLDFTHPENKTGKEPVYLFNGNKKETYPDFYKQNEIVIDAKYKHLGSESNEEVTNDYYQVITYMYRLKATIGVLLYPRENKTELTKFSMHTESYGDPYARFIKYGMEIPQNRENFVQFVSEIKGSETKLKEYLDELLDKIEVKTAELTS